MAVIKKVALAGANGALGRPTLQALLDADFTVTALTRADSSHAFPQTVKVAKVDYSDLHSLTEALKGQDALVSTLSTTAIDQQERLVDAAIAAGVARLIPSEFGCDMTVPKIRDLPVYAQKVQIEQEIERKTSGTKTTWTWIFNNVFFDYSLDNNFGIDIKGKKIELFDGGEKVYTTTPLDFVARGVAGVLQHPAETENKAIRLHGTSMTQKKLLEMVQRFTGEDGWQVSEANSADVEKRSYENLKKDPSNVYGWAFGFIQCAIWGASYDGVDFSQDNDNELLGLQEMSEKEVEDVIRSRV